MAGQRGGTNFRGFYCETARRYTLQADSYCPRLWNVRSPRGSSILSGCSRPRDHPLLNLKPPCTSTIRNTHWLSVTPKTPTALSRKLIRRVIQGWRSPERASGCGVSTKNSLDSEGQGRDVRSSGRCRRIPSLSPGGRAASARYIWTFDSVAAGGWGGAIKLRFEAGAGQRLRLEIEGVRFRGRNVDLAAHQHAFGGWDDPYG